MLVEHECMTCGDHEMLDPAHKTICSGCDNGSMQVYHKEGVNKCIGEII
jgi:hypothetical protein